MLGPAPPLHLLASTCELLLPVLLQQQAEGVQLVNAGGQPERQRGGEEQGRRGGAIRR